MLRTSQILPRELCVLSKAFCQSVFGAVCSSRAFCVPPHPLNGLHALLCLDAHTGCCMPLAPRGSDPFLEPVCQAVNLFIWRAAEKRKQTFMDFVPHGRGRCWTAPEPWEAAAGWQGLRARRRDADGMKVGCRGSSWSWFCAQQNPSGPGWMLSALFGCFCCSTSWITCSPGCFRTIES